MEPVIVEGTSEEAAMRAAVPKPSGVALMVIFGASGDLAKRKLLPALYNLYRQDLLADGFTVLGYARSEYSDDEFRERARAGILEHADIELDAEEWHRFANGLFYMSGGYDDANRFEDLKGRMEELCEERGTQRNRLFYLATPPSVYETVTTQLGKVGLVRPADFNCWTRLVVEKPFGHDLESARQLNQHILDIFEEDQVYRIDHYLGKETVQNILVFRFANGIFEPLWNRNYVEHVQITVSESIGVEDRGGYYDKSGALRDMVQNHLLQLVSLTAMEPPVAFDAKAVRDQKVNLLRSIRPLAADEVPKYTVRAQYAGDNGRPGYLEETGVDDRSTTETYVAWKLEIDNWRWNGVPFYLRTGKALSRKVSEIVIYFRHVPHLLFESARTAAASSGNQGPERVEEVLDRNILAMRIQPDEGINLKINAKQPGPAVQLASVNMEFKYGQSFGSSPPDAYQRLLLDVILGDGTLFTRRDEVEIAWDHISRIQRGWRQQEEAALRAESTAHGAPFRLPTYPAGTWGPSDADELLAADGQKWLVPDAPGGHPEEG